MIRACLPARSCLEYCPSRLGALQLNLAWQLTQAKPSKLLDCVKRSPRYPSENKIRLQSLTCGNKKEAFPIASITTTTKASHTQACPFKPSQSTSIPCDTHLWRRRGIKEHANHQRRNHLRPFKECAVRSPSSTPSSSHTFISIATLPLPLRILHQDVALEGISA